MNGWTESLVVDLCLPLCGDGVCDAGETRGDDGTCLDAVAWHIGNSDEIRRFASPPGMQRNPGRNSQQVD